ncbi:MAG TPA: hypothetical protein VFS40_14555, partial [Gemmatimonadales bacterium]|nr:hypothetical protein [Gemmatimonadales bacterium]
MTDLHVGAMSDDDVGSAGVNYSTVSLPAAMGFSYERGFDLPPSWTLDPVTMAPPFFSGAGFVGTKLLRGPDGANRLQLYSNIVGSGSNFSDPREVKQLYRYLSGKLQSGVDAGCGATGGPASHVCLVVQVPRDTRQMASTTGITLAPGQFATVVWAQIFAAPVSVASLVRDMDVKPGDPLELGDPAKMADGVNLIDSIAGYLGFTDRNGDGVVQESELHTVPRSLYGKAQLAQLVFESGFVLPEAPAAPDFFLVPGDRRVTVVWRPSLSERTGDPFFALAQAVTLPDGRPNPLYDPSFRQFDVEGYRIYRGRSDAPGELTLVAQFDYAGTSITDYGDFIQPTGRCAPELGVAPAGCPAPYGDGVAATGGGGVPLTGQIVQVRFGERVALTNGGVATLRADTVGAAPGTELVDNGVPFTWTDESVRNDVRYFYAVTAFDVNSVQSALASMESPRVAKPATPTRRASNYRTSATFATSVFGRAGRVDSGRFAVPTIDPATGIFSGPAPAADGAEVTVPDLLPTELLAEGTAETAIRLDSLQLGSSFDGRPARYFFTTRGAGAGTQLVVALVQQAGPDDATSTPATVPVAAVDPALAARFGAGTTPYTLSATLALRLPGDYYTTNYGRGCVNGADGFTSDPASFFGCEYNGSRWFDGPSPAKNETVPNPNGNNTFQFNTGGAPTNYGNVGGLTGVAVVHEPLAYLTVSSTWREVHGALGGAARAADFNLYWGAAGRIDSVVDVTHDVVVPFDTAMGASWGILTQPASDVPGSFDARAELTPTDIGCVAPLNATPAVQTRIPCTAPAPVKLADVAVLGPVAEMLATPVSAQTAPVRPTPGFLLYMPGHVYMIETAALPAPGTVWSLRTYVGAISGGSGVNGSYGPYTFHPVTRPFTAAGAEVRVRADVVNRVVPSISDDLRRVHPVPDPYYASAFTPADAQRIRFVNLPAQAILRIYTSSGVLVKVIEHGTDTFGGSAEWDVRSRTGKAVASGVYFYHIEAGGARRVGRFTIVNVRGTE